MPQYYKRKSSIKLQADIGGSQTPKAHNLSCETLPEQRVSQLSREICNSEGELAMNDQKQEACLIID